MSCLFDLCMSRARPLYDCVCIAYVRVRLVYDACACVCIWDDLCMTCVCVVYGACLICVCVVDDLRMCLYDLWMCALFVWLVPDLRMRVCLDCVCCVL